VDNRKWFTFLTCLLELPYTKTVNGSQRIIARHASIAIESVLQEKDDLQSRHDNANYPKKNAGPILQPDINQAEYRG
jgi:hypothetical protein